MGYIGNQTSNSYTSITKQPITGNGGTSYILDHPVANANEIEVFVNNVRQEPAVAYTVSGTALTMTGNVASTDDFYVVFQGKAIQTTVPPDDSVTTPRINDGAVTAAKVDSTLHLSTIKDSTGTNNALTIDSSGRVLTPARPDFYVEGSASYVAYSSGDTLAYNSDNYGIQRNVGGHYSTTTYQFTAPVAGLYFFHASAYANAVGSSGLQLTWKNSSGTIQDKSQSYDTDTRTKQVTATFQLAVGDTVEVLTEDAASYYLNAYGKFFGYLIG
jgi:hypothetical protein